MMLQIDPQSPHPPYEQLRRQLLDQIATDQLTPGERLPSVRRLAGDLGLAPNTVARCYRELEQAGVLITRGRNGTQVAPRTTATDQAADRLTRTYLAQMAELGFGVDQVVHRLRALTAG